MLSGSKLTRKKKRRTHKQTAPARNVFLDSQGESDKIERRFQSDQLGRRTDHNAVPEGYQESRPRGLQGKEQNSRKYQVAHEFIDPKTLEDQDVVESQDSLYFDIQRSKRGVRSVTQMELQNEYQMRSANVNMKKKKSKFGDRKYRGMKPLSNQLLKSRTPKARRPKDPREQSFKKRKNLTGGHTRGQKEEEYVPVYVVGDRIIPVDEYTPSRTFGHAQPPDTFDKFKQRKRKVSNRVQVRNETDQYEEEQLRQEGLQQTEGYVTGEEAPNTDHAEYSVEEEEDGSMATDSTGEHEENEGEDEEEEDLENESGTEHGGEEEYEEEEEGEEYREMHLGAHDGGHGKDMELIQAAQRLRERQEEDDFVVNGQSLEEGEEEEEEEELEQNRHDLPRPPKGERKIRFFK